MSLPNQKTPSVSGPFADQYTSRFYFADLSLKSVKYPDFKTERNYVVIFQSLDCELSPFYHLLGCLPSSLLVTFQS